MKFDQEKLNLILDLKDIVKRHTEMIKNLNRVVTSQNKQIEKLESRSPWGTK